VREVRKVKQTRLGIEAAQELVGDWRTHRGQFEEAFPELASMPEELRYVPVDQVASRLRDMQPRAEQQVEVVGLKIPTDDLVRWGTVLLLGAQLYLWIHVRELRGRLKKGSMGWHVAWIGIYRSSFAFAAVVVTTSLLPVLSYWTLLSRTAGLREV